MLQFTDEDQLNGQSLRVTGDDGRNAFRRRNLAGVDHDEQFHEVVVHLATARLDDVHVLATHRFANLDADYEWKMVT